MNSTTKRKTSQNRFSTKKEHIWLQINGPTTFARTFHLNKKYNALLKNAEQI